MIKSSSFSSTKLSGDSARAFIEQTGLTDILDGRMVMKKEDLDRAARLQALYETIEKYEEEGYRIMDNSMILRTHRLHRDDDKIIRDIRASSERLAHSVCNKIIESCANEIREYVSIKLKELGVELD